MKRKTQKNLKMFDVRFTKCAILCKCDTVRMFFWNLQMCSCYRLVSFQNSDGVVVRFPLKFRRKCRVNGSDFNKE